MIMTSHKRLRLFRPCLAVVVIISFIPNLGYAQLDTPQQSNETYSPPPATSTSQDNRSMVPVTSEDSKKTVADTAKAAIESYKTYSSEVQRSFDKALSATSDSYTKVLKTIDLVVMIFGAIVLGVVALLGFWGIKDYREFKGRYYEKVKELEKVRRDLADQQQKMEAEWKVHENLNQDIETQKQHLSNHLVDARKTLYALPLTVMAHQGLVGYERVEGQKAANRLSDDERQVLDDRSKGALHEATYRVNKVLDELDPSDAGVKAWALALRGRIFHYQKDYKRAIDTYMASIRLSEGDPIYASVTATTYYAAACSYAQYGTPDGLMQAKHALRGATERMNSLAYDAKHDSELQGVWEDNMI